MTQKELEALAAKAAKHLGSFANALEGAELTYELADEVVVLRDAQSGAPRVWMPLSVMRALGDMEDK